MQGTKGLGRVLPLAAAKEIEIRFLRGPEPRKNYFSGRKRASAASAAQRVRRSGLQEFKKVLALF
ncbi:hypothetical protein [Intestinimonas butyriciproducens]|uniref:hypothetical protein n=1 Tax=Intestinimonas butyriciproducens TaxID=1297617 RepID=UPI000950ED32|nr:hypothetical protein [Intestinimonas butyriciproducens]MCR1906809.1 hypothetical protein [Intestinimonas butyriciproducens]MDB7831058.1 hypothetical protein [Intestinimonas butyriciproducens]OLR67484.1 hypothetical protein BIV19_07735 [Intestinimonas butyriciproducens]